MKRIMLILVAGAITASATAAGTASAAPAKPHACSQNIACRLVA